jgi:predicted RNA-binding protein associated with RNAse of E/G family
VVSAEKSSGKVLLRCLDVEGRPRYDLPALRVGACEGYDVFWRSAPAPVIHHIRGETFYLRDSELVLVARAYQHCLSIALDEKGIPASIYANINLVAVEDAQGWSWRDLELDIKFRLDFDDCWRAILLDVQEFDNSCLNSEQRDIAKGEIASVIVRAESGLFPFSRKLPPWLGFDPVKLGASGLCND